MSLKWYMFVLEAPKWLKPVLKIPANASAPLAVTPVHPDAVGSYGFDAIEWIETELKKELPHGLRWWQRFAIVRQLEHDRDGRLCWRTILESTPRRSGKSVRLRAMALWRIAHADLFDGEDQIALHTGRDVAIVREIHRKAWRWAMERSYEGWSLSRGVGQEEVILNETNRWLVRSTGSVYGYDCTLTMIDEAWDVSVDVFTEGLEPSTLERVSPQNLLTSTAHRRATSLMKAKITAALEADDHETLLLLWGVADTSDPGDVQTWREASPHWSADREKMLTKKYTAALRGEADPEADDPDPMLGFRSQYLNMWILRVVDRPPPGHAVVNDTQWEGLRTTVPDAIPDAVAIEGWFDQGLAVVEAWCRGGVVTVRATLHKNASSAASQASLTGCERPVQVGKSLLTNEPALRALPHLSAQGTTALAAKELGRLIGEGSLRHDGGKELADQVLSLRVQPSPDGPRVVSKHRSDAIKAVTWAVAASKEAPEVSMIF